MDTCKGCGAPLRWITTPKGERMPLDANPVTTDDASRLLYALSGERVRVDGWGWLYGWAPHWPVCPAGDRFRRIGGGHNTPYKGRQGAQEPTSAPTLPDTLTLPGIARPDGRTTGGNR